MRTSLDDLKSGTDRRTGTSKQLAKYTTALVLQLSDSEVISCYQCSQRRLFVLGYNATLTTAVEAPMQPQRHYDQMKALARVNPKTVMSIKELCKHPENVVVILSGSECCKLEETFGLLPVWCAAENGVYMRPPSTVAESVRL